MKRTTGITLSLMIGLFLFSAPPGVDTASGARDRTSGSSEGGDKPDAGDVLVKFKSFVKPGDRRLHHEEADAEVLAEIPKIKVQRVRSRRGESTEELIQRYRNNTNVEYAEADVIFDFRLGPNDPMYPQLWALNNTGQTGGTPDADIDAAEAWDFQTGNNGVVVASIDSGVDYTHSDLAANIWVNPGEIPGNGVDDDGNGYIDDVRGWDFENNDNDPMDDNGHGTHTAGTIAGVGNNGLGITGVAWRAAVMPLKFMDSTGSGFSSNAAAALIYAANAGAQISNNSWGCFGRAACFSQTLENAIAYANTLGMTFVTSAGNDGANVDVTVDYPCTSTQPNVVCVAATDQNDLRPAFSSYGATSVDLGAPGVNILSTVPSGSCELCDSSGYLALNGTSMAGPHVAGAAAVLISRFPGYTHTQIINLILGWVDPVASLAGLTVTGGRLNLNAAVQSSLTTSPDFEISVSPTSQAVNQGDSTTYLVTGTSLNGYAGTVTLNMTTPDTNILGLFDINPLTIPAGGSVTSTLTVLTTASVSGGNHLLTVQGSNGALTHVSDGTLEVLNGATTSTTSTTTSTTSTTSTTAVTTSTTSTTGVGSTTVRPSRPTIVRPPRPDRPTVARPTR